jgi:hypothetical protein
LVAQGFMRLVGAELTELAPGLWVLVGRQHDLLLYAAFSMAVVAFCRAHVVRPGHTLTVAAANCSPLRPARRSWSRRHWRLWCRSIAKARRRSSATAIQFLASVCPVAGNSDSCLFEPI